MGSSCKCVSYDTAANAQPGNPKESTQFRTLTSYSTSTVGQLLYGRLSDIWSRKVILLVGLAIFFIGSLASSLANTVTQLIVFRALTGIGGGGLMTVAQLIVSDVVPLRERGKYQGILVSTIISHFQSCHFASPRPNCPGPIGCCCCYSQWHWPCYWRCAVFCVKEWLAKYLPAQLAAYGSNDAMRHILHAAQEG
jgi:MFS family permease